MCKLVQPAATFLALPLPAQQNVLDLLCRFQGNHLDIRGGNGAVSALQPVVELFCVLRARQQNTQNDETEDVQRQAVIASAINFIRKTLVNSGLFGRTLQADGSDSAAHLDVSTRLSKSELNGWLQHATVHSCSFFVNLVARVVKNPPNEIIGVDGRSMCSLIMIEALSLLKRVEIEMRVDNGGMESTTTQTSALKIFKALVTNNNKHTFKSADGASSHFRLCVEFVSSVFHHLFDLFCLY